MTEPNYGQLERKATTQHYGTILFKRLNGESVEVIAESLKMEPAAILRCLAWAEKNWARVLSSSAVRAKCEAAQTPVGDAMGRTSCARCNEPIPAGEYRVVLSAVEMKPPDYDRRVPSGRGASFASSYCDSCVAEMPLFELTNLWKELSDDGADPSAGPATEDASFRSVNVDEISEVSVNSLSVPASPSAGEAAQRARLSAFLKAPASRGMRPDMRTAAKMWADGASQNEVARKLGKDQSTVSRAIATARKMAYAKG